MIGLMPPGLGRGTEDPGAPLVSVIVTNHNYARFLTSCLENIRGQSYVNIECIVVDDASTDDSRDVLDEIVRAGEFAGPGRTLQVIKLPVNAGMVGAACEGFKRSTGRYIIFFDADDIMLPHLVEAHVTAFFYSRIGVGISSTDMFYGQNDDIIRAGHPGFVHFIHAQGADSQVIFRKTPLPFSSGREMSGPALALSPAELYHLPPEHLGWAWAATSALCFRREMVEPMLRRVPKIAGVLDAYLLRGIHPFTGAVLIDRPLVVYRIHAKNDWIKFPPIENFMNWDIGRETGVTKRIADEILQTHLLSADFYAQSLHNDDTFIQAIEWLYSEQWSTKGTAMEAFSTRAFLMTHEARLREAFGDVTYQKWMGPYKPLGRIGRSLWRNELLRPLQKFLRRQLGDAGIKRLRARLYR
jgi:glycosyltransferase involved in cell wall biosynthesis